MVVLSAEEQWLDRSKGSCRRVNKLTDRFFHIGHADCLLNESRTDFYAADLTSKNRRQNWVAKMFFQINEAFKLRRVSAVNFFLREEFPIVAGPVTVGNRALSVFLPSTRTPFIV